MCESTTAYRSMIGLARNAAILRTYVLSQVMQSLISASFLSKLKMSHIVLGVYHPCYSAVPNSPRITVISAKGETHHCVCGSFVHMHGPGFVTICAILQQICEHVFSRSGIKVAILISLKLDMILIRMYEAICCCCCCSVSKQDALLVITSTLN